MKPVDPARELRDAIAEYALTARRANRAAAKAQAAANRLEAADPLTLTQHDYVAAMSAVAAAVEATQLYGPSMGRLVHARRLAARAGIWSDPMFDAEKDEAHERASLAAIGADPDEAYHVGPYQ